MPETKQKNNILLVVSIPSQYSDMFKLALFLKQSLLYEPIIYFNLGITNGSQYRDELLKWDIKYIDYLDWGITFPAFVQQILPSKFIKIIEFIKKAVRYAQNNSLPLRFLSKVLRYRREKKLLGASNIRLIILAEDSEDYHTPQLVMNGHENGIKSIVFPYAFTNDFEFMEHAFFCRHFSNKNFLYRYIFKKWPKWSAQYKGQTIIKSKPAIIFSAEWFGKTPPNPWLMNSGFSDYIVVESDYMADYFIKAGVPVGKIVKTGYVSLDNLANNIKLRREKRRELALQFGLRDNVPWILCALTPPQRPRPMVDFQSYEEYLARVVSFFKKYEQRAEIIIKFHPRMNTDLIRKYCRELNIKYYFQDTADLIALSEHFVASISSTIRWALAAGLRVTNYDVYAFRYTDFVTDQQITNVEKFQDFQNLFSIQFEGVVKDFEENSPRRYKAEYGLLDRAAGLRILKLFDKIIS